MSRHCDICGGTMGGPCLHGGVVESSSTNEKAVDAIRETHTPVVFLMFADPVADKFHYRGLGLTGNEKIAIKLADLIVDYCNKENVVNLACLENKPPENSP